MQSHESSYHIRLSKEVPIFAPNAAELRLHNMERAQLDMTQLQ